MSLADRIDQKLAQLVDTANDFLPDGVVLGYAIPAIDDENGVTLPNAEIIRVCNEFFMNYRRALERLADRGYSWASTDLAAFPGDASNIGDVVVVFDLMHIPSRTAVIRTYSLQTLVNLYQDGTRTNEQKRQIVKTQLQSFYQDLVDRLP